MHRINYHPYVLFTAQKEADQLLSESIDFLPAYDSLDLEVFGQGSTTSKGTSHQHATETPQVPVVDQIAAENAGPAAAAAAEEEEEEEEGNADVPPEVIESM